MFKEKIKKFWLRHESRVIIFASLILVAGVSFQMGVLKSGSWEKKPLIIEKPVLSAVNVGAPVSANMVRAIMKETDSKQVETKFVGSRNSDKYHTPDCRFVKNIKEENLVYFSSEGEARAKGYEPGSCVKK